nr:COX3 [Donax vittatus]
MAGMKRSKEVYNHTNCSLTSKYTFCGSSTAPLSVALFFFFFFTAVGLWLSGSDHWMKASALSVMMGVKGGLTWMKELSKEMSFTGFTQNPTPKDIVGLKLGFSLFILSEVFFFFAGFWGWVNTAVGEMSRGCPWPPAEVNPVNPLGAPMLGSGLLFMSGILVSASYKVLQKSGSESEAKSTFMLGGACISGVLFLAVQKVEMSSMNMSLGDSSYSSLFYFLTVLHGTHVGFGVIFMGCVALSNQSLKKSKNLSQPNVKMVIKESYLAGCKKEWLGVKLSMWYWHFVDVVWLFVFSLVYVWSYLNRVWG